MKNILIETILKYSGILKESISYQLVALKINNAYKNNDRIASDVADNIRNSIYLDSFESDGRTLKFVNSNENTKGLAQGIKNLIGNKVPSDFIDDVCNFLINTEIKHKRKQIENPSKFKKNEKTFARVPNYRWGPEY